MPAAGEATIGARLQRLGIELPEAPRPLGQYVAAVQTTGQLVLSGMLPLVEGQLTTAGRLGESVPVEAGRAAAWQAALNALAIAAEAVGLDRLRRVVRATVFMTTSADFASHAAVADGASELFAALFDEGHTRVAAGAMSLPLGATIVLDVTFDLTVEAGP
jgi:enamine deaminase RidA (YjgF/YER057c/UK114 family)